MIDTLRNSFYPPVFENTCMVLVLVSLGQTKGRLIGVWANYCLQYPLSNLISRVTLFCREIDMLAGQSFKYRMCATTRHAANLRQVCKDVQENRTQHNLIMMGVNMGIWSSRTEKEKINVCPMSFECLREKVSGILRYRFHMLNRERTGLRK